MRMHQPEIDKAYLKNRVGPITLSLSAKFKPAEDGTFEIEAGISFTAEKIKDSIVKYYNEKQGELFEFKKEIVIMNGDVTDNRIETYRL